MEIMQKVCSFKWRKQHCDATPKSVSVSFAESTFPSLNLDMRIFSVLFILILLLLSGCSSSIVVPRDTSGRWLYDQIDSGPCMIDRSGTRPRMAEPPSDLMIGMMNKIEHGPDPFPCNRIRQWRYVNGITWNLTHAVVRAYTSAGRTLQRAEIEVTYHPISNDWGDYWEGSNLAVVRLATAPGGGTVTFRSDHDPGILTGLAPLPGGPWGMERNLAAARGGTETRDVTPLVRAWMAGTITNFGLVLDSTEFGLGDESVERDVVAGVSMRLVLYFDGPP